MAEDFNKFPQVSDALQEAIKKTVVKVAMDLQANIQTQIQTNGQIDTGFMLNSVYTVTSEGSSYQGGANALPEVEHPEDEYTAYTAVAASYAVYQNYGTVHIPARPFFEPAIDQVRPEFDSAMSAIADKLK